MRRAIWVVSAVILGLATACGGGSTPPSPSSLPQTGSVSVDLATGIVTVSGPPALAVSGVGMYSAGTQELSLDLTVLNSAYARLLFNLKMLMTNLNDGAFAGDGMFGGTPFAYYGPEALAPGASTMRTLLITGIAAATTTITFDMEWLNHRMIFASNGWDDGLGATDSSGTGLGFEISSEPVGFGGSDGDSQLNRGVVSLDGRFVYCANHNQPCIVQIDTTTMLPVNTLDLTGAANIQTDYSGSIGHTRDVRMTPDGRTLFCVYTEGDHTAAWGGDGITETPGGGTAATPENVYLVRMDRATMTETGRVALVMASSASARGHSMATNANWTRAAVTVSGEAQVWLIDLTTMTAIDVDALTGGTQPYDVSAISPAPQSVAMNPNGSKIYVAYRGDRSLGDGMGGSIDLAATFPNDGTLSEIDVATGMISPFAPLTTMTNNRPGFLEWGPDGRLYYGRKSNAMTPKLQVYNPGTGMWTTVLDETFDRAYGICFVGTSRYIVKTANGLARMFATATDTLIPNAADGGDDIPLFNGGGFGHGFMISPF